jgi:glyoxylase-like metal-dependent hydrolase (beta-lactamase superfamily II)
MGPVTVKESRLLPPVEESMQPARSSHWLGLALAAAASLAPLAAQSASDVVASDDGARMLRIAGNVYVIEHDDATDEWPNGNTGVIVGRTGLFVIDSGYLPSRARADIALIRRISDKPARFLMTTHWHFDHNNGASAYRDAYPGVTLLAERNTARWIELNQEYWKALSTARERILFAGDILVRSPLPYVGASWPVHWVSVLRDLEAVPAAAIVPGHGPVQADHAYTRAVRELLEATLERVEALVRAGRSLAEVQDMLALDDQRQRVPDWNGPAVSADDWTYTRRTLAERAFMGVRGQGGL